MHAIQGISSTFFHYFFGRVCHCTRGFSTWDPEGGGGGMDNIITRQKSLLQTIQWEKSGGKMAPPLTTGAVSGCVAPPVAIFRWHCFPKRPQGGPILAPLIFSVRQCWSILMDIVMQTCRPPQKYSPPSGKTYTIFECTLILSELNFWIYVRDYADAKIGCVPVACHLLCNYPLQLHWEKNATEIRVFFSVYPMVASFGLRNRDSHDFSIIIMRNSRDRWTSESVSMIHIWKHHKCVMLFITHVGQDRLFYFYA